MPYTRKTRDVFTVQQYTAQGWEDVTAENTRKEGRERLREYQANEPQISSRLVTRREKITA